MFRRACPLRCNCEKASPGRGKLSPQVTDEGAPTDAANGCSPLIRLLTAFAATCSPSGTSCHLPRSGGVFPPRGEGFSVNRQQLHPRAVATTQNPLSLASARQLSRRESFFAVRRIAASPSQSPAVTALPRGEPLARPRALPYCQSLSPRPTSPGRGQILPAPGRNVTAGDKVGSRCRQRRQKGEQGGFAQQRRRGRGCCPQPCRWQLPLKALP